MAKQKPPPIELFNKIVSHSNNNIMHHFVMIIFSMYVYDRV